jgi:hypothetical protein
MLTVAFVTLKYVPSVPNFFRAFIMERYKISSKALSAPIEMMM